MSLGSPKLCAARFPCIHIYAYTEQKMHNYVRVHIHVQNTLSAAGIKAVTSHEVHHRSLWTWHQVASGVHMGRWKDK